MKGAAPASLRLRPARAEDARLLHEWVNSSDSLAQKGETREPVPWPVHEKWLESRLEDPTCILEIVDLDGVPVGQVRLEPKEGGHHVDIYVVPERRGTGIAHAALQDVIARVAARPIIALVRTGNTASRNLFLRLGFRETGRTRALVTFKLED